jgi:DnaD/phage-associated family protein
MSFDGFPKNVLVTPVPDPLFNSLLEQIEDLAELKVTLRAIWLLGQKRGAFRTLNEDELLNDPSLLKGVKSLDGSPQERLRQGLEQAVTRGTLLRYLPESASDSRSNTTTDKPTYLLNTEAGRRELARRQAGSGVTPDAEHRLAYAEPDSAEPAADTRPNIFALYEDNIGTIGVMIAEELKEAEEHYPSRWISDAFRIAVHENKRSWGYISAILRRWASEGRGGFREATKESRIEPGIGQKAGATLWETDEVEDGEPGRYTPADNRPRYPEDYQRR